MMLTLHARPKKPCQRLVGKVFLHMQLCWRQAYGLPASAEDDDQQNEEDESECGGSHCAVTVITATRSGSCDWITH